MNQIAANQVDNGVCEQPAEQQSSGSGGPPVEPEGELVEVVGQLLPADPVVQGATCRRSQNG
jgi:hypothetical protein